MQPGDTITPKHQPDDKSGDTNSKPSEHTATKHHQQTHPSQQPVAAAAQAGQQYSGQVEANSYELPVGELAPVSWTASEFVDHEKNNSWYMSLAAITGVAVVVIYLITRDIVTALAILIAAGLFGVTARRRPRTLQYELDSYGVHIGDKLYEYSAFKAFSVIEEGAFNSIQLMPLKRFLPPISLYFPPDQENQIIDTLGNYLPHEERSRDPIDRLMRKVRF